MEGRCWYMLLDSRLSRLILGALLSTALVSPAEALAGGGNERGKGPLSKAEVAQMLATEHVAGELLVRFEPSAGAAATAAIRRVRGKSMRNYFSVPGLQRLQVTGDLGEAMLALSNEPDVRYVEPNYRVYETQQVDEDISYVPSDPLYELLWGLHLFPVGGIDAERAWAIDRFAGEIIVAHLDTGIAYWHPDLAANIWTNPREIPGNSRDDDRNGFVDDIVGWDCVNDDNDPWDDGGHGTHTAGTIGMVEGNQIGGVGVAHRVQLMALKVLDATGSGTIADVITCIDYSTMMGAHLSNNSYGGDTGSQGLEDAIQAFGSQGGIFVAAAGNQRNNSDARPFYPASHVTASDNVVAVAATNWFDDLTVVSNYGASSVDLAAPGSAIWSTVLDNRYEKMSGTSMAAPHVAGAAALYLSQYPQALPCEVRQALIDSADPTPSLEGKTVSGGRLNLRALLETQPPACGECSVDVLAWKTSWANLDPDAEYEVAVDVIRSRNPSASITEIESDDPASVAAALASHDVFFIPKLQQANFAATIAFATAIEPDLQTFVSSGGVVVFAQDTSPSTRFIRATGLMDVKSLGRDFGTALIAVVDPSHPVTRYLPAAFTSTDSTSYYMLNGDEVMLASNSMNGASAVAIRNIGAGVVVQLGFDYFSTSVASEQILSNAVALGCGA